MNKVTLTIAIGAVALAGVAFFGKPVNVEVKVPTQGAPVVNITSPEVNVPATVVNVPKQSAIVGAVSSPDILSPYFSYGDTRLWGARPTLLTASTTVCNIQSPAASTTLEAFSIDIKTSTTSASHLQFGIGTVPAATGTLQFGFLLPANVGTQVAATSSSVLDQIIPGSSWLAVKASPALGAASAGTVSMTGTCSANFRAIQY